MEPRGYRLRFPALKLVLTAIALLAIFAGYGSLKGVEPGISLLVVLMALKVLEAHTAREFQIMVIIGWVLCLCGFFLSQDFAIALCLMTGFALLLVALIQFHRGSSPGAFWPALGTTFRLLAQAAPLVILLFLLFPRINTGFRFELRSLRWGALVFPNDLLRAASQHWQILRDRFPRGVSGTKLSRRVRCIGAA